MRIQPHSIEKHPNIHPIEKTSCSLFVEAAQETKHNSPKTMSCPGNNNGNGSSSRANAYRHGRDESSNEDMNTDGIMNNSNSLYRHLLDGRLRPPTINQLTPQRPVDPVDTITAALAVIQDCDFDDVDFTLDQQEDETTSLASSRSSSSSRGRDHSHHPSNSKHRDSSGYRRQ